MKNIAIISTSLNSGGAERIAGLLSKELSKIYNVYLFLLSTENVIYEYGGIIVNIGSSFPFFEYSIKANKEKYKIDVAISFLEMMNFANIRTRTNERVIISERCAQSYIVPKAYAEDMQIRRYYNYADEMAACSIGVKHEMESVYGLTLPITPIYNFVNQERIKVNAEENFDREVEEFLGNSEYFINIGRLHNQKNQKRLIRQFGIFHKRDKLGIKLLIVGIGELYEKLSQLIAELDLHDYVKIIAYGNNPFRYLARARALVLSSKYEGLPNVLLEAMVVQCPIVAVDCVSGPRELLDDDLQYDAVYEKIKICKRGILVTNDGSESDCATIYLAEAMQIILNKRLCDDLIVQEVKYMGQYDNKSILNQWIEVIERPYKQNVNPVINEMKQLDCAENIYIYGAGLVGKSHYIRLSKKYEINGFVVSKKDNDIDKLYGLPVFEARSMKNANRNAALIVGVGYGYQNEILNTAKECGFENIVFPWIEPMTYEYYSNCKVLDLKSELIDWSRLYLERNYDIDNPIGFNEKIQWLKLYDNTELKTRLADKVMVRDYVKETIGEKYLIPCLGVWDSFDEIDWDKLPDSFVLKCNHGSGTNEIIQDKTNIDYNELKLKFEDWMNLNYAFFSGFEMHYKGIVPQILAEELLLTENGEDLKDYKIFVFNGKAKLIQVDIDRQHEHRRNIYDLEWNYIPVSILYPTAPKVIVEKPDCLQEMIIVAEKLGKGFKHVRVDLYICNNRIFFGEMTFTHGSGTEKFTPVSYERQMGDWILL